MGWARTHYWPNGYGTTTVCPRICRQIRNFKHGLCVTPPPRYLHTASSRTLLAWCRKESGAARVVQFALRACIPFILLSRKFQSQCQAEADTYVYSYPTLFYTSARNLSRAWIREWNRPEASEPTSKSKYAPFGLVERTSPSVTGSCPSPA